MVKSAFSPLKEELENIDMKPYSHGLIPKQRTPNVTKT